jgi:hypothetical protein
MSTTITPTEQNIEINVNNDVIDINVTNEIVDVNATTQQIDINVAGAYPIPNPVLSVFGRTGEVVATEGDYTLTQLGDVTLTSPSNGQVLKYNGTAWVNGTDAGGITTLNTLTALSQTFATGTSGTDFNISSATATHTFNLPTASATNRGALSSADWTTFNSKQNALTNPITGTGTSGQVAYFNGTSSITSNAAFAFTPTSQLLVNNSVTAASAIARGTNLTPTLTAAANNDVLVGLDINPTFTNGAFTGVSNIGLRVRNSSIIVTGTNGSIILDQSNATSNYLYSLNATATAWRDFTIQTNGQNVLNVLSTGVVTIGTKTVAASTMLTINNNFGSGSTAIESTGNIFFKGCNTFFVEGTNRVQISTTTSGQNEIASLGFGASGWRHLAFQTNSTTATLFTTGNFLIQNGGTHTDAGFRLDVNGTARVQGQATITGAAATSATTALLVQNSANLQAIQAKNDGTVTIGNSVGNGRAIVVDQNFDNYYLAASHYIGYNQAGAGNFYARWNGTSAATIGLQIGNGTNTAAISSILDLTSTTKGFLPPRMNATQRNAISSPATGLIVYDTTDNEIDYYNGTAWQSLMTLGTQQTVTGVKTFSPSVTASSALARGTIFTPTLVAAANNDVLVGLDINPTFTNGAFTNVTNWAARISGILAGVTRYNTIGASGNSHYMELISTTSTNGYLNFKRGAPNGDTAIWLQDGNTQLVYNAASGETRLLSSNYLTFRTGGTTGMQMFTTTRNVVLQNGGTFTDAGFRLDVNGTARVQGALTISTGGFSVTGNSTLTGDLSMPGYGIDNLSRVNITNAPNGGGLTIRGTLATNTLAINFQESTTNVSQINWDNSNNYLQLRTIKANSVINFTVTGNTISTISSTGVSINGNLITGGTSVNASAQLQVDSTTKGFLPPRMTTTQKNAISSPATGLVVYDTTLNKLSVYTGAAWETVTSL